MRMMIYQLVHVHDQQQRHVNMPLLIVVKFIWQENEQVESMKYGKKVIQAFLNDNYLF